MKRLLLLTVVSFFGLVSCALATPQTDIIKQYERLGAMFEIGTSRVDIQNQLVETKILLSKLKEVSPDSEFTKKAESLFEQIRLSFVLTDLTPTKKSGIEAASDAVKELLPELKALAPQGKKKR